MRNTCLNSIYEIAKTNKKIIFVGSDLGAGVLQKFKKEMPTRFFMEGISEQYIVGMAAGLAKEGLIPYVNTISTFLTRRCFEQIVIDLCLHNLPVRLIGNGGGLVYGPLGPTHQAIEDIGILRLLPNMTICAVSDSNEMKSLIKESVNWPFPLYIRIARGGDKIISSKKNFKIGKNEIYNKGKNVLIVSTGVMTQIGLEVVKKLKKEKKNCTLVHVHTLKPFSFKSIEKLLKNINYIVSIEEHLSNGGLGTILLEELSNKNYLQKIKLHRLGLKNNFITKYGSQDDLLKYFKLDSNNIYKFIKKIY